MVPRLLFLQPRVEPEQVVVLRDDVPAQVSSETTRLAAASVFLGVDFLDSIWEEYRFSITEVVADNASGGGFFAGKAAAE